MCDASSAMAASVGMQVAGTYASVRGAQEEGEAKSRYYGYLADQTESQQALVDRTTEFERTMIGDQAARQAKQIRTEGAKTASSQRAAMAANGVTGVTAEDVARDSFDRQTLDEMAIKYSADLKNWELENSRKMKKWDLRNQVTQYRLSGRMAEQAASINSTASLLGGAGQIAGTTMNYQLKTKSI